MSSENKKYEIKDEKLKQVTGGRYGGGDSTDSSYKDFGVADTYNCYDLKCIGTYTHASEEYVKVSNHICPNCGGSLEPYNSPISIAKEKCPSCKRYYEIDDGYGVLHVYCQY